MKNNTAGVIFLLIIILGAFFRLYRLPELMPFSGDQGRDMLAARDILLFHQYPFVGPPTSLSWLYLGPFVYYLWAAVLYIANFNPVSVSMMTVLFDVSTIGVLIIWVKRLFGARAGLIAGLLYATSPMAVIHSRDPLHVNLIMFFSTILLFFTTVFMETNNPKWLMPAFFVLGLLVQLHATGWILFIVVLLLIYRRLNIKQGIAGIIIFLVTLSPVIIHDVVSRSYTMVKFAAWIPYRGLSTLGLFGTKNLMTVDKLVKEIWVVEDAVKNIILINYGLLAIVILLLAILYLIREKKNQQGKRILLVTIGTAGLILFIHGQPSEQYFLFIVPVVIAILAYSLSKIRWGILAALLLAMFNMVAVMQNNYFVKIPFSQQVEAMKYIITDADGAGYKILPPPDIVNLPDYNKNYQYLGWRLGNEPKADGSISYMIVSGKNNSVSSGISNQIKEFPSVTVIKLPVNK